MFLQQRQSNPSVHYYPENVSFGFHTPEDIRKISVVEITNPETFNALGYPTDGGLYDKRMGLLDRNERCATCNLTPNFCPGHYGHIELPLPCYHPLFLRNVSNILKLTCPACKRFLVKGITLHTFFYVIKILVFFLLERSKIVLSARLELLCCGLITEAQELLKVVDTGEHDEELEGLDAIDTEKDDEEANESLRIEVNEAVQRMKEKAGIHIGEEPAPTRNVENMRQTYLKSFLKKIGTRNKCYRCGGGWHKIVIYKSRIVYSLRPGTVSTAVG